MIPLKRTRELEKERAYRTLKYGEPPTNPFLELRALQNLSINHLSMLMHVDRKALSRLEKGMYASPLPSAVQYWCRTGIITEQKLVSLYEEFQVATREFNTRLFGLMIVGVDLGAPHPLHQLRHHIIPINPDSSVDFLQYGLVDVAEAMCVPHATLQSFENKWVRHQSVPKAFKQALSQMGYDPSEIVGFENDYSAWRQIASRRKQVSVNNG